MRCNKGLPRRAALLLALALAAPLFVIAPARAADPDALWKIVHNLCVVNEKETGNPAPCAEVEIAQGEGRGYAVLKDINGATQFLLIPTARIAGIESPQILAPGAANYFAAAWRARSFIEGILGQSLPRDWVSLAINSEWGRSQNQLHIHVDCIRSDVRETLARQVHAIGRRWKPLAVPLLGHRYVARTVAGEELAVNPFQLLASGVPGAAADMGQRTLVVVGWIRGDGKPEFVLLADHADRATQDRASGEELQDHACALAHS
jgi:CDP-diacylglycerol pyrophosphatase